MSRINGIGSNPVYRARSAPELAAHNADLSSVVVSDNGDISGFYLLVTGVVIFRADGRFPHN